MKMAMRGFDAILSPTVHMVAPPLADIAPGRERDDAFFKINALLLRSPSAINLLGGCVISLPLPCTRRITRGFDIPGRSSARRQGSQHCTSNRTIAT